MTTTILGVVLKGFNSLNIHSCGSISSIRNILLGASKTDANTFMIESYNVQSDNQITSTWEKPGDSPPISKIMINSCNAGNKTVIHCKNNKDLKELYFTGSRIHSTIVVDDCMEELVIRIGCSHSAFIIQGSVKHLIVDVCAAGVSLNLSKLRSNNPPSLKIRQSIRHSVKIFGRANPSKVLASSLYKEVVFPRNIIPLDRKRKFRLYGCIVCRINLPNVYLNCGHTLCPCCAQKHIGRCCPHPGCSNVIHFATLFNLPITAVKEQPAKQQKRMPIIDLTK